jgi:hypothetical protein
MSFTTSDRGFKQFEPVETQYGHVVRVYESSAAMQPCLWIATELAEARGGIEPEKAHAHCTLEQAGKIRDAIDGCIANHYQQEPAGPKEMQSDLQRLFERHGLSVAVGLTREGVAIRSQDERVDAANIGEVRPFEDEEHADTPITSSESSIVLGALMDTAWLHEAIAAQTNLRPDEVKLAIEMIADVGRLQ